ncbi:DUF6193 family natural product biosynthesis protein [Streptomyces sp. CBMA156]|uniref:DUF6193 family natural product biosynthesis protein n=1 Tax=Streptomyces sp. CBMA156 TaxID=1930280 RepID=UPI001661DB2A|nr:DUF6193 family natural product biosynthesis protein [Streptomyces sp. CBMA156]MBD0674547.1 hypothetical protein [Streptomyces sp. CBMA156]
MDVQAEGKSTEGSETLASAWEFQADAAAHWDEHARNSTTWVPPLMAALVDRARSSTLSGFFPFTSHTSLLFSTGPLAGLGGAVVAPVTITLTAEGLYHVSTKPDGTALETADPDEAVTAAEHLIAGWLRENGTPSDR